MTEFSVPNKLTQCRAFHVGNVPVGGANPLVLLAGPCVIESREHTIELAGRIKEITERVGVPLVFKASYDKANRSSSTSFRGPGIDKGLDILAEVKATHGLPLLTDVHREEEAPQAAETCDLLQIPAFLCRQTDLVQAIGRAGKPVNVKKAQFMAPEDMANIVWKLKEVGCEDVLLTERGTSFGYRNLVSDFRALPTMQKLTDLPICFDATHSVQHPGGLGNASGGDREFVPVLARAACAVGVNALFMEVHNDPANAKSDGPNLVPLNELERLLEVCLSIDTAVRRAVAVLA